MILAGTPADEIASRSKSDTGYAWFDAGQAGQFPAQASYEDSNGSVGVMVSGGPVEMKGTPFSRRSVLMGARASLATRVFLPWPPLKLDGTPVKPEFKIEVVRDPAGCNLDPVYGLKSAHPMVSVFRRPRPAANLKYATVSANGPFNIKTGTLLDVDPETGRPVSMNLMSDAR